MKATPVPAAKPVNRLFRAQGSFSTFFAAYKHGLDECWKMPGQCIREPRRCHEIDSQWRGAQQKEGAVLRKMVLDQSLAETSPEENEVG